MVKEFTTKQREREAIEFVLDGESFSFIPPKRSALIMSVIANAGLDRPNTEADSARDLLNWVSDGLGDQSDRIVERLQDPDDDFDLEQLNEVARYLLSQGSNRPTKRR